MIIQIRTLNSEDFAVVVAGDEKSGIRSAVSQKVWVFQVDFDQQVTPIKIVLPATTPDEEVLKELTKRILVKIPEWTERAFGGAKRVELHD